jgi:CBS domain-containing protein
LRRQNLKSLPTRHVACFNFKREIFEERDMRAREMMNTFFVELRPSDSVRQAAEAMRNDGVGIVCICNERRAPVGVVTDRDVVLRVCAKGLVPETTELKDIMSLNPVVCQTETPIEEIKTAMTNRRVGRVLVVDQQGELVGLISLAEIWHYESPLSAGPLSRRVTEREFRARPTGGHNAG